MLRAQGLGQRIAVETGHADVEDAGVRQEAAPAHEGALTIVSNRRLEALVLERFGLKIGHVDVVVHHQYAHIRPGP